MLLQLLWAVDSLQWGSEALRAAEHMNNEKLLFEDISARFWCTNLLDWPCPDSWVCFGRTEGSWVEGEQQEVSIHKTGWFSLVLFKQAEWAFDI